MICGLLVSPTIMILPMDLLIAKTRQKKNYLLHSIYISISEYNILLEKKNVCNFIGDFFLSIGILPSEYKI
jgi:hypothetical protein